MGEKSDKGGQSQKEQKNRVAVFCVLRISLSLYFSISLLAVGYVSLFHSILGRGKNKQTTNTERKRKEKTE